MRNIPRRKITPRILFFAALDMVGMVLFASGALWVFRGLPLFFRDFPSSMSEGVLALIGGLFLMLWSAAQILREMMRPDSSPADDHD